MSTDRHQWIPTFLTPQDHLMEYAAASGTPFPEIRDANKDVTAGRAQGDASQPRVLPGDYLFRAGDVVKVPPVTPKTSAARIGGSTVETASPARGVEVVLRLVAKVSGPPLMDAPASVGFDFVTTKGGFKADDPRNLLNTLSEDNADKHRSGAEVSVTVTRGVAQALAIRPKVTSKEYAADGPFSVEVLARPSGVGFTVVDCRVAEAAGDVTPRAPRLVEVGPFRRVFELEYQVPKRRGLAAWYQARREVFRGRDPERGYGPKAPWVSRLASKPTLDGKDNFLKRYRTALHRSDSALDWCGTFAGYMHLRAGFDLTSPYQDSATATTSRYALFLSAMRIHRYALARGCTRLEFPREARTNGQYRNPPAWSPDQCRRWLEEKLQPWGAQRGDLILFTREKDKVDAKGNILRNAKGEALKFEGVQFHLRGAA